MIGPHTVVRERPLGTDIHGDPVEGEGDLETVEGCLVYPRGSAEQSGRETTVVTGKVLLAPGGADILSTDVIRYQGKEFTVEGDPGEWPFLDGGVACLQIALTERRG